ncbi:MAG: hypothetical protein H6R21_2018, partial [Proteobacteria bacterium]|nr:hypothetical protein [Pseudomonadota bacterium]
ADAAGHRACRRAGRRRCDRRAREHPPPYRGRHDAGRGGTDRRARDCLCRGGDDGDAGRGVRATGVCDRQHRTAVPRICADRGFRSGGVGFRCADADADDVLQAAAARAVARPCLQCAGTFFFRFVDRLRAVPALEPGAPPAGGHRVRHRCRRRHGAVHGHPVRTVTAGGPRLFPRGDVGAGGCDQGIHRRLRAHLGEDLQRSAGDQFLLRGRCAGP